MDDQERNDNAGTRPKVRQRVEVTTTPTATPVSSRSYGRDGQTVFAPSGGQGQPGTSE